MREVSTKPVLYAEIPGASHAFEVFHSLRTENVVNGVDRFLALLAGEPNIREVIAFPKAASGSEPMTGAPTSLPEAQLRELGIRLVEGNS
jgi:hypothetical protein